jgi:hypothetical protein
MPIRKEVSQAKAAICFKRINNEVDKTQVAQ